MRHKCCFRFHSCVVFISLLLVSSESPTFTFLRLTPPRQLTHFQLDPQWDCYSIDGVVGLDDFTEYYFDISAMIEDDAYFTWMMRSAWGFGGEYSGRTTDLYSSQKGSSW